MYPKVMCIVALCYKNAVSSSLAKPSLICKTWPGQVQVSLTFHSATKYAYSTSHFWYLTMSSYRAKHACDFHMPSLEKLLDMSCILTSILQLPPRWMIMPQSSIAAWLQKATGANSTASILSPISSQERCVPASSTSKEANSSNPERRPPLGLSATSKNSDLGRLPPLPGNARIEPCDNEYVDSFRRLNALLLPIPYPQGFYNETLNDPCIASLTRVVTWKHGSTNGTSSIKPEDINQHSDTPERQLVAAIRCRLLPASSPSADEENVLYISTIGTLAPFRGHSLACHLLAEVTRVAVEKYKACSIMAHVWEANEDAIEWYGKRGFEVVKREEGYYRRLAPKTAALLVRRSISTSDFLTLLGSRTT